MQLTVEFVKIKLGILRLQIITDCTYTENVLCYSVMIVIIFFYLIGEARVITLKSLFLDLKIYIQINKFSLYKNRPYVSRS